MTDITTEIDFGESTDAASIKIIGVGGGGGNAANRMYKKGITDVDFIIINSDKQDLKKSPIPNKIPLGDGRGCGSNVEKGERYAKEKTAEIEQAVEDTQMVFITAGMGGGTGTGAAPVIAEICKKKDILTVGIVTLPFRFEGPNKYESALRGIEALHQNVDALLIINNETLTEKYGDYQMSKLFEYADDILAVAASGISDILQKTGFRNVDFEDVRAVMKDSGIAVMSAGSGSGENRAFNAIEEALDSPLLNKADIRGAKQILLNISSSKENELTGNEINIIMEYIRQKAETDVNITWGYMIDNPDVDDEVKVTMIATGFEISDIPELKKEEEPIHITFNTQNSSIQHAPAQQAKEYKPGTQTELNLNSSDDITINTKSFDYESVRGASDISAIENIPAYMRQQQNVEKQDTQTMEQPVQKTQSQITSEIVANRINSTESSRFTLGKDEKGFFIGENKYLNKNVD